MSQAEQGARSFGPNADTYHLARPGYPDAAVDWALDGDPGTVLDLGAGTGILTVALAARGLRTIAVDPSPAMLATLARGLPAVPVLAGTAEAIPLAGASVDAIVAGAAFHWFARPAADAQMARVLRPGGSAALLWNPVDPGHPLGQVFTRARRSLGLDPREYDPDVELDRRWFGPTRRRVVGSELTTTVDDFLAQLGSRSYLLTAGPGERARILAEAGAVAAAYAVAGRLTVPVRTTVLHARTRG